MTIQMAATLSHSSAFISYIIFNLIITIFSLRNSALRVFEDPPRKTSKTKLGCMDKYKISYKRLKKKKKNSLTKMLIRILNLDAWMNEKSLPYIAIGLLSFLNIYTQKSSSAICGLRIAIYSIRIFILSHYVWYYPFHLLCLCNSSYLIFEICCIML